MQRTNCTELLTLAPGLTDPRWIGEAGVVSGLQYADAMPGGNDTLQCTLGREADWWDQRIAPGRIVQAYRGGMVVWEGIMQSPQPSDQGWQLNAIGAGHYGDFYAAYDTGGFVNSDPAVNNAISRGMRWVNPGIGNTGMYLNQPPNDVSLQVSDWLNQITSPGAYTWHVGPWNVLSVFEIPTTVTRLLVANSPAARTLAGYINALYAYYQATADTTSGSTSVPATYGVAEAENDASIAVHGRYEIGWDTTSAGIMTGSEAALAAAEVLARYTAASYANSFTVGYGQYLTTGGQPVDLGAERAGEVCRLILASGGSGGDIVPDLTCTFPVGAIAYDDDQQTAAVTPFQSVRSDISSLLQAASSVLTSPTSVS